VPVPVAPDDRGIGEGVGLPRGGEFSPSATPSRLVRCVLVGVAEKDTRQKREVDDVYGNEKIVVHKLMEQQKKHADTGTDLQKLET